MSYAKYEDLGKKPDPDQELLSLVPEVQSNEDLDNLLAQHRVVVLDVYATWCRPCKKIAPEYARLAQHYNSEGGVVLAKANVDAELQMIPEVRNVPTFFIFRDGAVVFKTQGADLSAVQSGLEEVLMN